MADEEEWTCGKGLAANAVLPEKIGTLTEQLANVLENHMRALPNAEADNEPEIGAYQRLVHEHRAIAAQLATAAEAMKEYRSLPMGPHDHAVLAEPAARDVFEAFVRAEDELLSLLKQHSEEHHAMLGRWAT